MNEQEIENSDSISFGTKVALAFSSNLGSNRGIVIQENAP
jgi:hypothetical protein